MERQRKGGGEGGKQGERTGGREKEKEKKEKKKKRISVLFCPAWPLQWYNIPSNIYKTL